MVVKTRTLKPLLHPTMTPSRHCSARPHLTKVRKSTASQETGVVAAELGQSVDDFLTALVATGLKVPEKPRQKPVMVEQGGESFWLTRNTKDQVVLNAKVAEKPEEPKEDSAKAKRKSPTPAETSDKGKKPRRPRSRRSAPKAE